MGIRSHQRSRRRFLQNACLGAVGVSLSSCGWRLADVRNQVVETTRTGNLHIYTWSTYINETLLREFQKQTGVKGISEVMPSNEEMMTAFAAGKARVFSVLCPSDYAVEEMYGKGYLQALDMSRIQGLETILPNLAENGMIAQKRYSVPLSWGTTGLLYNSDKISEPPTDWDVLWRDREKLTRRMTMLDDIREVFGAVLHSLGYSQNTTDLAQLKAAYEKIQQLKPHLANFTTDAWRDPLVAGDIWIAMGYSTDATELMKSNPKIRYVIPKSGTNLWVDTMSIPITAPNVDAAYDWINYVSDPNKSAEITATLGYVPVTQAAIDLLSPEIRSDPVKFPSQEVLARCETMKKLPEAVTTELDKYWTQIKT